MREEAHEAIAERLQVAMTVCVGDAGTGIDKPIIDRVFDPFFTTKPMGRERDRCGSFPA